MPKQIDRQTRILQSASKFFSQKRFDQVLMEDVAQNAGVGKGTLYRYFRDKEDLHSAVVFDAIAKLKKELRNRTSEVLDPLERLRASVWAIVSFLNRNRNFFRLMGAEGGRSRGRKTEYRKRWWRERGELIGIIGEVLRFGADTGNFDIRHTETEAQILLGMIRSTMRFNGDKLKVDEMVEEILRIFLHGVQKPIRKSD